MNHPILLLTERNGKHVYVNMALLIYMQQDSDLQKPEPYTYLYFGSAGGIKVIERPQYIIEALNDV